MELEQSGVIETEITPIQKEIEKDHSQLSNLDYEHSGHTGFAPAGDYVEDSNYTHTDNNYTTEEKTKLAGLNNYDDTEVKGDISSLQSGKADKSTTYTKSEVDGLIPDVSSFITKNVNDLTYYTLATSTGSTIDLEINSSTYVVTLSLKNSAGTVISTDTIDLPLESVVVSGSYDSTNKKIVLTLQSGSTIDIPVGDLVSGLQTEITSNNKLSADLVDDTNATNKFVSASDKTTWSGKQDALVSGTNIKTINNTSVLGSGNIDTEVIQYSTLPTASQDNLGQIVQYTGTTDSTYTNGYFYQCVSDGESTPTYSWENINVQASSGGTSGNPITILGDATTYSNIEIPLENLKVGIYKPQFEKTSVRLTLNGSLKMDFELVGDLIVLKDYSEAQNNEIFAIAKRWSNNSNPRISNYYLKKTVSGVEYDYSRIGSIPNTGNDIYINSLEDKYLSMKWTFNTLPESEYAPTKNYQFTNKKYVDDSIASAITTTLGGSY